MHTKICRYSFVIIFSVGCISAMEQDRIVRERVHKGVVSTLAVNDYIVNVSTVYQGLLKEACFKQDILHNMIKSVNKALKEKLVDKGGIVYQLSDKKTTERLLNKDIHYLRIPCFRYMEVIYKNSSKLECKDDMEAHVKISTYRYYISAVDFNSRQYICKENSFNNISTLVKNNIVRLLPQGKSVCIELYSPDSVSDWIKVTNCCEAKAHAICNEQYHNVCKDDDLDYGYIGNSVEVNERFCTFIFGVTIMAALFMGSVLY
jgi:hypothetical protein